MHRVMGICDSLITSNDPTTHKDEVNSEKCWKIWFGVHPLFVFNQFGDLEQYSFRSSNPERGGGNGDDGRRGVSG